MTPHNKAKLSDIAKTVIMPGDPLRARWIAENFLTNYKLVNEVRGMYAYTGKYGNKLVTVMAHGMGIPSIGIYTYELFNFYKVKNIIRVGSAGAYDESIKLRDVIAVKEAFSDSSYAKELGLKTSSKILTPTKKMLDLAAKIAKENRITLKKERVHSTDTFYNNKNCKYWIKQTGGAKAVEMEAFALYANANFFNRQALCLLTISDSLVTGESLSPDERQSSFKSMVKLALEMTKKL